MKKLLFTICCCLISILIIAQTPAKTITIEGTVLDSITSKPLGYVTIAVINAVTKQPVKSSLTKDDGTFAIKGLTPKPYLFSFIFIGYKTKTVTLKGDDDFNLGPILLSASNNQLKEVQVSALKPLMKQEVDRISYDVAADPESKSLTALDMMRKVPLVSVDGQDNIQLRGSGSFKILLNGKETALLARNPLDILKSMPGANIVKIEVITTPPAKYDAEGLAGIINIITKKDGAQGYSGSVNGNYNSLNGPRFNLNTTIKQGKFGVSGFIGISNSQGRYAAFDNNTRYTTMPSTVWQTGAQARGNKNSYANAELSYEIDTLNLITGTFNSYANDGWSGNNQLTRLFNGNGGLTQAYDIINYNTIRGNGMDAGLNYQLGFKRNKDQILTMSYKYMDNSNTQFNDIITTQLKTPNSHQNNKARSKEYTTQLDYIQPLKLFTLEAGGKMILRNNVSNFNTDTLSSAGYITNAGQTNNFIYNQDVYSLYNSYTVKFSKWIAKGGVRFEQTNIDANFQVNGGGIIGQRFSNLVPSISVKRDLAGNRSITFGYTQRIQRPGINQLNPFSNNANPLYVNMGNPNLHPAVNNNFELSYGNYRKGSINVAASYSFANNSIQQLSTINGNVTTQTFANVGKARQLALDVNLNYPITKQITVNINAELMRVWLNGVYNSAPISNTGQQGHLFTNGGYKFGKGYRLGVNVGYDSRYVFLQGVDNWFFGCGTNLSKELFKGQGSIFLSAQNPFSKYNKLDFFYKTSDFVTINNFLNNYRSFAIGFNYKFGKLNGEIKKNQRGINNDDTGGGRN